MNTSRAPFSLELAQIDFNESDVSEPVAISEVEIANTLREMADSEDLSARALSYIVCLAEAFDNPSTDWKLTLNRRTRGRFRSLSSHFADARRDGLISGMVAWLTQAEGLKTEAAVAKISEEYGWSRALIFSSLKRSRNRRSNPDIEVEGSSATIW